MLGALFISLFGWITFNGLRDATNSLEEEAKSTGSSSEEFSVVSSFLSSTREVFTIMETYPQNYPGVFNVAYDSITLSKESINILSDKYFTYYTDEILSPLSKQINHLKRKPKTTLNPISDPLHEGSSLSRVADLHSYALL